MARVDMAAARPYFPRGATRTGTFVLSPAEYLTDWGVSRAKGPHMRLDEPDMTKRAQFPYYACLLEDFLRDYEDVSPGVYRKKMGVIAVQLTEGVVVTTQEGDEFAPAGSFVVQDVNGRQWPISEVVFHNTYSEA